MLTAVASSVACRRRCGVGQLDDRHGRSAGDDAGRDAGEQPAEQQPAERVADQERQRAGGREREAAEQQRLATKLVRPAPGQQQRGDHAGCVDRIDHRHHQVGETELRAVERIKRCRQRGAEHRHREGIGDAGPRQSGVEGATPPVPSRPSRVGRAASRRSPSWQGERERPTVGWRVGRRSCRCFRSGSGRTVAAVKAPRRRACAEVEIGAADHEQHLLVARAARPRRSSAPPAAAPRPARPRAAARATASRCARADRGVVEQVRGVDVALRQLPGDRADAARAERIGGDAGHLDVDRRARLARPVQRRRAARARAPRSGSGPANHAAMPAIRPPPPTLTSARSGTPASASTSAASVPAPTTTSRWS